jgi:Uncharacterized conserved protein (DUF2183)
MKKADPEENEVWLLDNTAYRPVHPDTHDPQPWQAEFVACFFRSGREDAGKYVSLIADQIGLDGHVGSNHEARKLIKERIQPFINAIAPARTVDVKISSQAGPSLICTLGPSYSNGISSQIILTGGEDSWDGTTVNVTSADGLFPALQAETHFAGPEGWAIISDIDDTIKITQTVNPVGTLQSTFAEEPKTTEGMPKFYKILNEQFKNPAWFYLSASPYNLYPFLHKFLHDNYLPGTMILRDASWMDFGGLLQSLTQGVQAYKVDRMAKIHKWLPKRKFICVGDSTQKDPETYAEIYKKFPGWIHAIYIRKVVDAPSMEKKNKEDRFTKAFEGVPNHIWKVFIKPDELADHVKHLAGEAHMAITGLLQQEQEERLENSAKKAVPSHL